MGLNVGERDGAMDGLRLGRAEGSPVGARLGETVGTYIHASGQEAQIKMPVTEYP